MAGEIPEEDIDEEGDHMVPSELVHLYEATEKPHDDKGQDESVPHPH